MILFSRFQAQLPAKQLQKGRFYFDEELVCNLTEARPGYWKADVSGATDYQVQVTVENDEITHTFCDCPHEVDFCKHVVAVLYAMLESASPGVDELLAKASEEQVRELLAELAKSNPEVWELLKTRLS